MRLALVVAALLATGAADAAAAGRDNLVPNPGFGSCSAGALDGWAPGRTSVAPSLSATSRISCASPGHAVGDATSMRLTTGGGETGDHWQVEGARSACVETPGIAADPRPVSFAYFPHVHAVQFGLIGPGLQLVLIAYDGPGCTGTETRAAPFHGGGGADAWLEFSGTAQFPEGTRSVAVEIAIGCPTGVTCLKESGGDPSYVLIDDIFLGGDGIVVTDCDDPALATVTRVAGDLVVDGVEGCGDLSLPSLVEVGGGVSIEETGATVIDLGSLAQVGGGVVITETGATAIDLGSLAHVAGGVEITDNAPGGVVSLGSLEEVAGGVELETAGDVDLTGAFVGGDLTVTATGASAVSATTARGATQIAVLGDPASARASIPAGTFDAPVDFSVVAGGDEPPAQGAAGDAPATVDPLSAHRLTFSAPARDGAVQLTVTLDLAGLAPATRAALVAGVADGSATVATRGDEAAAPYVALGRCSGTQTPEADGCVDVDGLDGSREPAAASDDLAYVRFRGPAGRTATYAAALVTPLPPAGSGGGQEAAAPGGGGTTVQTPIARPPGNAFRFTGLRRDARRGTARLGVSLPAPGRLVVAGRGIRTGRHRAARAGQLRLPIRLRGAALRRLRRTGRATVLVRVTYTPAGGVPQVQTTRIRLVMRR